MTRNKKTHTQTEPNETKWNWNETHLTYISKSQNDRHENVKWKKKREQNKNRTGYLTMSAEHSTFGWADSISIPVPVYGKTDCYSDYAFSHISHSIALHAKCA